MSERHQITELGSHAVGAEITPFYFTALITIFHFIKNIFIKLESFVKNSFSSIGDSKFSGASK